MDSPKIGDVIRVRWNLTTAIWTVSGRDDAVGAWELIRFEGARLVRSKVHDADLNSWEMVPEDEIAAGMARMQNQEE